MALHTLRAMAAGGMYDQVGGGFARYSRRRALARPALREDALRQRAARARVPARLPGRRASRCFARVCARDARLGAARAAQDGGRVRLGARRRLRGRRGQVLRVDARRGARRARRRRRTRRSRYFGLDRAGELRGRERPGPRGDRDPAGAAERSGASCYEARAAARAARARRQAPDRLERADDLRAGRRGRGARAPATTSTPRVALRRVRPARDLRDADGRLLRTYNAAEAQLDAYLEDHAFLLEALLDAVRGDVRPALVRARRARSPTRCIERFADPEHGGFFSTAADHEPLVARRKDLEDTPIPAGDSSRRLRAAAAGRADRRGALRGRARVGVLRAAARDRAAAPAGVRPPAAGAGLPLRAACARSRSSATDREPLERVVRERFRPHVVLAGGEAGRACRCSRAARRSTAAPPPTCASASPASGR